MKSVNQYIKSYISWILHCQLKHRYTEQIWKPLSIEIKKQKIIICVYGKLNTGLDDHHNILQSASLYYDELIDEFEII